MAWNKEKSLKLIMLVQKEPCIWNPLLRHNSSSINEAWARILVNSHFMSYSAKTLKMKWFGLLKKYRLCLETGSTAWFAFEIMDRFLGAIYPRGRAIYTEERRRILHIYKQMAPQTKKTLKIIQANVMRSRLSHHRVYTIALENEVDIIIAGEPNKKFINHDRTCIKDKRRDVAVWLLNRNLHLENVISKEGYVCLVFESFRLYCCYISSNISMKQFQKVESVMNNCICKPGESIILGDLNAKSSRWGSPMDDRRGKYLADWMAAFNLVVHNNGNEPTFVKGDCRSFIDVTMSTAKIAEKIQNWRVLKDESLSDHRFIYFEVVGDTIGEKSVEKQRVKDEWKPSTLMRKASLGKTTLKCVRILKGGHMHLQIDTRKTLRRPYWWNEDVVAQRNKCINKRRLLTRRNRRNRDGTVNELFTRILSCFQLMGRIDETQRRSFKQMLDHILSGIGPSSVLEPQANEKDNRGGTLKPAICDSSLTRLKNEISSPQGRRDDTPSPTYRPTSTHSDNQRSYMQLLDILNGAGPSSVSEPQAKEKVFYHSYVIFNLV
ncbi:unnamed protein product [Callosobruchus maculatus]|uniref:MADF domain-containing protein n=2 Tax=Callosobruchus maculatus TaxID=64391 RepID=A0A653D5U1_CALMS|nr:unnamed protein product [Callosobruchus maculatus]